MTCSLNSMSSKAKNLSYLLLQVLLPCSLLLSLTGPIDTPAMDIHGMVDPLYFTLSPPVVRLIILAANSLIPPKVTQNYHFVISRVTVTA